jgi:hypothetical protein
MLAAVCTRATSEQYTDFILYKHTLAGDTVPQVALACGADPGSFFASRQAVIALLSTLIVLPISALRDLHKLALASFVSVASVVLIVGIVLFAGKFDCSALLLSTIMLCT